MSKQARLRAQELRRVEQEAAAKRTRRRRIVTTLGALVIAGLVAAIAVVIVRAAGSQRSLPEVTGEVVVPQHLTTNGSIPVGRAAAPVTVQIYYDYMCPACGAFEAANSSELERLVADGTARVELHPIAFLDRLSSGTQYSTRSAAAVAVVADAAPDSVWAFHTALYQHQPAEGSEGLTDEQIADVASGAGVPADSGGPVHRRHPSSRGSPRRRGRPSPRAWSTRRRSRSTARSSTGNAFTVGPLTQAIESAAAGQ